jgi:hypothetical protein
MTPSTENGDVVAVLTFIYLKGNISVIVKIYVGNNENNMQMGRHIYIHAGDFVMSL